MPFHHNNIGADDGIWTRSVSSSTILSRVRFSNYATSAYMRVIEIVLFVILNSYLAVLWGIEPQPTPWQGVALNHLNYRTVTESYHYSLVFCLSFLLLQTLALNLAFQNKTICNLYACVLLWIFWLSPTGLLTPIVIGIGFEPISLNKVCCRYTTLSYQDTIFFIWNTII